MNHTEQKVLALLRKAPLGMTRENICKAVGGSKDWVYWCLRELRRQGMAEASSSSGRFVLWGLPENMHAIREHVEQHVRTTRNITTNLSRQRKRERDRLADERAREEALEKFIQIEQRIVSASDCEPPKLRAPYSIFHLAEAA